MHFLISIGILLAITGMLLIYLLKQPLKLSDRILIVILLCFMLKFTLDELMLISGYDVLGLLAAIIGTSMIITCSLFIKSLTNEGFLKRREFNIYLPLILLTVLIFLVLPFQPAPLFTARYNIMMWILMIGLIMYYFYICIRTLQSHQHLIKENYSTVSATITINWMIVILLFQVTEFIVKTLLAVFSKPPLNTIIPIITNEYCFIIETFLLVVLGIWQRSIPVFVEVINPVREPDDDLERCLLKIEQFMTSHKPYLDPELTIEKLSDLMRVRKLLLSQTLNRKLDKNFFTYIKEYRIQHVIALLRNKNHSQQTIMDIAYQSGFNSKTGFNRAFREVTGKTPTEFI